MNHVLQAEYQREQKGPVSVVDCVCGHLVSAIHSKVSGWLDFLVWKEKEIEEKIHIF